MITGGSVTKRGQTLVRTLGSASHFGRLRTVDFESDGVVLDGVGEHGVLGATGEHLVVVLHRRPQLEDGGRHVAVRRNLPILKTKRIKM